MVLTISVLLPVLLIWKVRVRVKVVALSTRTLPKSTGGDESGDTAIFGAACAVPLLPTQSTNSNSPIQRVDINKLQRRRHESPGSDAPRILQCRRRCGKLPHRWARCAC